MSLSILLMPISGLQREEEREKKRRRKLRKITLGRERERE
jgi:hypothetical protein